MSDFDAAFATAMQRTLGDRSGGATPASQPQGDNSFDAAFKSAVLSVYGAPKTPPSAREQVEGDAITRGAKSFAADGSDALGGLSQGVLNLLAGGVRGAGSIASTAMRILPNALGGDTAAESEARRKGIDENMAALGAQTDSLTYKGGQVAGEIAGTAGAGGVIAAPLKAASSFAARAGAGSIPALDTAATALASGGFQTGAQVGKAAEIATRVGAGAAAGAASAGMVNPGDAGTGALIGGAAPAVVRGLGGAGAAIRDGLVGGGVSQEVAALAKRARQLGIHIPADRIADSKPLNAVAASLNYVPLSGRTATEEAMNSQLNRALSRTMGQDTPNMKSALDLARVKLGNKFDQFLKGNTVRVDHAFMQDLNAAKQTAMNELETGQAAIITKQIDEIMGKNAYGAIDGQAAYNIKKTLDRIGERNTPEAWYALDLKGKLMDALNRSVGPQEAEAFKKVRQQYSNMLEMEKVLLNGAGGDISIARLAGKKDIRTKDLQELADIAAEFVKPREGQHGAAQRFFGAGGVIGGVGGTVGGSIGGALGGAVGAGVGLGAAAAAGRSANAALNSQWARNAVLGAGTPAAPATPGLLTQGARRALPVGGAAVFAPAGAEPQPTPAPAEKTSSVDALEQIASAGSVDEAIAGAFQAAGEPAPKAAPAPEAVQVAEAPAEPPASEALMAADTAAPPDGRQPSALWTGRRGAGYMTPDDALAALPSRQRKEPGLDWKLERMASGFYRLAGYEPQQAEGDGLMAQAQPEQPEQNDGGGFSARMTPTGTLAIDGDSAQLLPALAQLGITKLIKTPRGVLVGVSQARQAMELLQGATS